MTELRQVDRLVVHTLEQEHATLDVFSEAVRMECDVVHFIGYGDEENKRGILYFEDENGDKVSYRVEEVAALLSGRRRSPVLGVLDTWPLVGSSAFSDVLASIAPTLLEQGKLQAVIGVQSPINFENRQVFYSQFYNTLLKHGQVDHAVLVARQMLFAQQGMAEAEWVAPVLYLGAQDGVIFEWV